VAEPVCLCAEITSEQIENLMGENLNSLIQKSTIIGYLRNIPGFSILPFFKLEWIAEAFQKVKYNNLHEAIFDS
jgi:hypothetical protein